MHISGLARVIPAPSEAVLIKLAGIAAQVDGMLAAENPLNRERVGIKTVKNDRRRTMEAVLVLLADRDVLAYLGELERLGLLPIKR
jgi:hypothetical protein